MFDFFKTGTVARREHLALHDRAVHFHLIEPTGMDGRVQRLTHRAYADPTAQRGWMRDPVSDIVAPRGPKGK